ncbi:MAG: ribosomal L7Ae/L30e/S12e/Gadd45 family protein [Nitrososphaerota archaeon]|nr:ribosomal L7Ae/L30e/S12e/Gadd45 family protein [Nitrososphaerota archaeon]MDG7039082.1 ribosomal L7Ae/L30e/S12e/Gadd45 family protein [Nitrososphaerota archaeon]MDG7039825.1 ribosomal L7Ae/L30e/S12e/Gadd45 family protein [Nitrososphaerota archaeon]MDG7042293.1 ribosomal L7Ae/L30e/S12e/Gadd45 family protein [Nitrososphaerota archaeon]MDG7046059.1 ribosomal L7Ae/L30e/S12e/Gadd45 family protein [Nitrososphaerota archaeon]
MEKTELLELIKYTMKDSKYIIGLREVKKSIKSVKLVIYSRSLVADDVESLKKTVPAESYIAEFDGTSVELGKAVKKMFPVSVLAFRSIDPKFEQILKGS